MEQIRTAVYGQARPATLPDGCPPSSAPSQPVPQRHPAPDDDDQEARGEHVHSEPPPPAVSAAPKLPQRHSVRAQVLTALRAALMSGELAPGEIYSAPALADRFGVSATPVREAMQRLVSEGAVETVPNRGFRVAECSARDLAELADVRALLEIPAVLRVARSVPHECWEELRPLAEDTLTAAARGDRTAYADADCAFHGALLELTGNRRLVAVAADIQRRAQRRTGVPGPVQGAAELVGEASEHVTLLEALQTHDLAAAERLMRAHVAR